MSVAYHKHCPGIKIIIIIIKRSYSSRSYYDKYRNLQRRRAVLPAIARHLVLFKESSDFWLIFYIQKCATLAQLFRILALLLPKF